MIFDKHGTSIKIIHVLLLGCFLLSGYLYADETITISVQNQTNTLIENVVISAFPKQKHLNSRVLPAKRIIIDQIDKEFISYVTAVQKGTLIDFPNHDQIHHHVYSFSPAKAFEIPLYKGSFENPILFDKLGIVALGCNIHDWMSAYIYVVDTPYFSITNDKGQALLNLPAGTYDIHFWHPDIDIKNTSSIQTIKLALGSSQTLSIQLDLKKVWSLRRGPLSSFNRRNYR